MSTYRETTIAGKAAQRGITEQRELPQRSKKARPIVVEYRGQNGLMRTPNWTKWGSYSTVRAAEQTVAQKRRSAYYSAYYEFRIKP